MLTVVCWKWRKSSTGYQLPGPVEYTARHVNVLANMLKRHLRMPYRLVCLTDDPEGINCETLPIPTKWAELGGCYRRLWLFSEEAKTLGERIASIDLDCVILRDVTRIFSRSGDFVINTYKPRLPDQRYNGGLMLLTPGARKHVWEDFSEAALPALAEARAQKLCIGTDQAWIRLRLGRNEKRFSEKDGVVEASRCKAVPPQCARVVMYAGKRDPSLDSRQWAKRAWR